MVVSSFFCGVLIRRSWIGHGTDVPAPVATVPGRSIERIRGWDIGGLHATVSPFCPGCRGADAGRLRERRNVAPRIDRADAAARQRNRRSAAARQRAAACPEHTGPLDDDVEAAARAVEKEKEKKAAKTEKQQPARQAASGEAAPAKASSPFNGSWQFSNGQKACMMTLSTSSGSSGSVSASGDCWNAYTKAKGWKLQGNEMVLTDSGNEPIARLQSTGATRYDGYGADGEPVVLVR
ncbi:MAG: AprI/Inh family metalloprotease inhibitor [Methylacidiphilales bacterium]|nr:AprI/Inh family metalloprotease inhibitor [Candidatus Methylacidiphilales bacterium]